MQKNANLHTYVIVKSEHVLLGPSESSGCAHQTEPEMERLFFYSIDKYDGEGEGVWRWRTMTLKSWKFRPSVSLSSGKYFLILLLQYFDVLLKYYKSWLIDLL